MAGKKTKLRVSMAALQLGMAGGWTFDSPWAPEEGNERENLA